MAKYWTSLDPHLMRLKRLLESCKAPRDIHVAPKMICSFIISADRANSQDLEATSTQSTWQAAGRVSPSYWTSPQTHLARRMIVSELQDSPLQLRKRIRLRTTWIKTSTQSLSTLGLISLVTTAALSSMSIGTPKNSSISPPQQVTSRSQSSQDWTEIKNDLKPL